MSMYEHQLPDYSLKKFTKPPTPDRSHNFYSWRNGNPVAKTSLSSEHHECHGFNSNRLRPELQPDHPKRVKLSGITAHVNLQSFIKETVKAR